MNRNEIKVDRLEIRMKGGDSNSARKLGASIGEGVLQQIAQQVDRPRVRRSISISNIDAGTVRLENSHESGVAIAEQIAARVSSKMARVSVRGKR